LDNEEWLNNVTSGDYQKYYETMVRPVLQQAGKE
jgi:hypothetical protein